VTPFIRKHFDHLPPARQCAVVALIILAAFVVAVPIGLALVGPPGAWAAAAAALTVLFASCISIFAASLFQSRETAMWRLLASMGLRMSIPMAACFLVLLIGGPLVTGGFVYFVLAFYLAALPIDTLLAVAQLGHKPDASF
jgi:hypothetical protein